MKIKNLGWYITMLILFGIVFYVIPKYQIDNDTKLFENNYETIAYCQLETKSLLSYKNKQLVKWNYTIDGRNYRKVKDQTNNIQDSEYYIIHYNPQNKEDIVIDYKKFVIKGNYKNTSSLNIKEDLLNNDLVTFEYFVNDKKYKRIQSCELNNGLDLEKEYLVKYKVENPKIAYVFLDSIRK
ncbi:hypothetical protein [Lacinutrix sp. Bg11-31]|uniref:hypothetical protein n=1 Tax=Lacinutrix sp. Bg11-31 TaxID=2057808 RepID=UPI000C30364F|nr:hypothetical protein [Lacinutrix sp. Bg11-31]AUC80737.1 hypothetical protein CW733_00730 [Lacinutrix sp. Bg11-31]